MHIDKKSPPLSTLSLALFMAFSGTVDSATFTVENVENSGPGSLRQAILDANDSLGEDVILFDIPTNGPHTIKPTSPLPEVTDSVTLDGFSQGSSTPNPADDAIPNTASMHEPIDAVLKIELDGTDAGFTAKGLTISASNVTVRGLVINRFGEDGILIDGGIDVRIEGCFIGTDIEGLAGLGNRRDGIRLVGALDCRIGDQQPGARNLISDNRSNGIQLLESTMGTLVGGNFIGVNADGEVALGNRGKGIAIGASTDNTIGGATSELRNILSGNNEQGIGLQGGADRNRVQGNYIGTNRAGTAAVANRDDGVLILNASDNILGGTAETSLSLGCQGACNLVSGNIQEGIALGGANSLGNRILGNYIGTNVAGSGEMKNNFNGLLIYDGATRTQVGGVEVGEGNKIAFNGGDGVAIPVDAGPSHSILGNAIHDNGVLGIDLNNNGVTGNDVGPPPDQDSGANGLQNFPEIESASAFGGDVRIEGILRSTPNTEFRLEFFVNAACDVSQHGEGERFLGFEDVSTDNEGLAPFITNLVGAVSPEEFVTSTATVLSATSGFAETSEFSECAQVVGGSCPTPLPDFVPNGRADANDLIALLEARLNRDSEFDLTCDHEVTGEDLFQFSLRWQDSEAP